MQLILLLVQKSLTGLNIPTDSFHVNRQVGKLKAVNSNFEVLNLTRLGIETKSFKSMTEALFALGTT